MASKALAKTQTDRGRGQPSLRQKYPGVFEEEHLYLNDNHKKLLEVMMKKALAGDMKVAMFLLERTTYKAGTEKDMIESNLINAKADDLNANVVSGFHVSRVKQLDAQSELLDAQRDVFNRSITDQETVERMINAFLTECVMYFRNQNLVELQMSLKTDDDRLKLVQRFEQHLISKAEEILSDDDTDDDVIEVVLIDQDNNGEIND